MFRKILIANDGSPGARKAMTAAILIAKRSKAELHMICVAELPGLPATMDEVVEEKLEANHKIEKVMSAARAEAKAQRVKLQTHIAAGHAVPRIVEFAESGRFDLVVIGFMGHSALYNRLIGSTTDRVVELAQCAVLVVK
jgi:nucleotide-binding universal stress UspA family protein